MTDVKRHVTQEELDVLFAPVKEGELSHPGSHEKHPQPKRDRSIFPNETVGVHLKADRTSIVYLSGGGSEVKHCSVNVGYEKLEECFSEIANWLADEDASKVPIYLSVTGKPARFIVAKMAPIARNLMLKAFRLQLKQSLGQDPDNLFFVPMSGTHARQSEQTEYLVASVDKTLRDEIVKSVRQYKLKIAGWDLDILSMARAANYLWQRENCEDTSRFLILLEWDHCHLIVASAEGQLITLSLSIGMNSFMEHLVAARGTSGGEDSFVPSDDSNEIRQRKLLANQAIHDVYVPFAQQVKTQLYAACNEYGISLPTHFAVVGAGASLLGITESLATDFGLTNIATDRLFPTEMITAFGSVVSEKSQLRMNFMPHGGKERWRNVAETLKTLRSRIALPKTALQADSGVPFLTPLRLALGMVVLFGVSMIPVFQRIEVTRTLASQRVELQKLMALQEQIKKAQAREAEYLKKASLKKLLEPKRVYFSRAMKEVISILPDQIRLESVSLKGENLVVKGSAKSHDEVQAYLHAANSLQFLYEPTPVGVVQEKDATHFEISFRMKTKM